MPPNTGGGQGLHDLRARALRPHDGQQAGHDRSHGHDLGAQAQQRPLQDGLVQALATEAPRGGLVRHRLLEVDHHHHAGLHRRAEQGDQRYSDSCARRAGAAPDSCSSSSALSAA